MNLMMTLYAAVWLQALLPTHQLHKHPLQGKHADASPVLIWTMGAVPRQGLCIMQVLAKKMTVLYKLSKEQLSSQHHYDFGLRALKSVLVMAGSLKRSSPDMSEALVLMRALRDMNLPKFVYDDVPLFLGLINDLFPGKKNSCLLDVHSCLQPALHCSTCHSAYHGPYCLWFALLCSTRKAALVRLHAP